MFYQDLTVNNYAFCSRVCVRCPLFALYCVRFNQISLNLATKKNEKKHHTKRCIPVHPLVTDCWSVHKVVGYPVILCVVR